MAWVERRRNAYRVRLRLPDGTVVTDSVHETRAAGALRAKEIDVELGRETSLDPRDGRITLTEWATLWRSTHQAGPATTAAYASHLRIHILPRLGRLRLVDIRRHHIKALIIDLRRSLSARSTADVIMLTNLLLNEAVADRRIAFNPAHGVKVPTGRRPERPTATTTQVTAIAARMSRRADQILVITAAYTGMRWGELTGLARDNLDRDHADLNVHPDVGALHEVGGRLFLGPPKTADSARHIRLPNFLVALLQEVCDSHPHPLVFCGARGRPQRRSNFTRRAWTPAVAGDPCAGIPPILTGMHFHDLRHTHKTWLIEDSIPEIAQAQRPGHRLPGVRGIYSHVTEPMQQRIAQVLQQRWASTLEQGAGEDDPRALPAA